MSRQHWERFAFLASGGAESHATPMPDDLSIANRDAWVALWQAVVVNLGLDAEHARELAEGAYDSFAGDPLDEAMAKAELFLRSRVRVTFENRANGIPDDPYIRPSQSDTT